MSNNMSIITPLKSKTIIRHSPFLPSHSCTPCYPLPASWARTPRPCPAHLRSPVVARQRHSGLFCAWWRRGGPRGWWRGGRGRHQPPRPATRRRAYATALEDEILLDRLRTVNKQSPATASYLSLRNVCACWMIGRCRGCAAARRA